MIQFNRSMLTVLAVLGISFNMFAQEYLFEFGKEQGLESLIQGKKSKEADIKWINVNTEKETWRFKGDELICEGQPIGVIRSEKQYENFIMYVEWK
ncbi:MAG: DUF1080 domain-containing protein, partial [Cyclobacteriaceae bacterium]